MKAPDSLRAVAALRRALAAKDYAGAARLVSRPETLDALDGLIAQVASERAAADRARAEAVTARLAEAERARVQAGIGPLLNEVIGVLAEALGMPRSVCITCKRSLGRSRNCSGCGTRDARSDPFPASWTEAA